MGLYIIQPYEQRHSSLIYWVVSLIQDGEYKNNTFKGKKMGSVLSLLQVPGKLSNDDERRLMVTIQC